MYSVLSKCPLLSKQKAPINLWTDTCSNLCWKKYSLHRNIYTHYAHSSGTAKSKHEESQATTWILGSLESLGPAPHINRTLDGKHVLFRPSYYGKFLSRVVQVRRWTLFQSTSRASRRYLKRRKLAALLNRLFLMHIRSATLHRIHSLCLPPQGLRR